MAKEINKRLQNFLDKNPQFKGPLGLPKKNYGFANVLACITPIA